LENEFLLGAKQAEHSDESSIEALQKVLSQQCTWSQWKTVDTVESLPHAHFVLVIATFALMLKRLQQYFLCNLMVSYCSKAFNTLTLSQHRQTYIVREHPDHCKTAIFQVWFHHHYFAD